MTDEQLVTLARHGDEHAAAELVRRYEPAAFGIERDFFLGGADRDDVIQEALIGLFKAIRDFDPAAGTRFTTFAGVCMRRNVITAIKAANRLKHQPLSAAVRTAHGDDEDGFEFDAIDLLEAPHADAVDLLDGRRRAHLILRVVADDLSAVERVAIVGRANGLTYSEIYALIELIDWTAPLAPSAWSWKTVDNALQRARRKIAQALRDDGLAA